MVTAFCRPVQQGISWAEHRIHRGGLCLFIDSYCITSAFFPEDVWRMLRMIPRTV